MINFGGRGEQESLAASAPALPVADRFSRSQTLPFHECSPNLSIANETQRLVACVGDIRPTLEFSR